VEGGATDHRQQLADLEQLIDGGTWDLDLATGAVVWSVGLCRLYGVDPATFDATYDNWFAMVHPDDRAMVGSTVEEAIASRSAYNFEHRFFRATDGSERWTRCRGRVITDEHGDAVRVYGVSVDATDEYRSAQLVQDFIANAAHELRTPAAAIAQAVHALHVPLSDADRARVIDALTRQANRLNSLTSNLLDLARVEAGPASALIAPVAVGAVVGEALAAAPPPEGTAVDVGGVPEDLWVRADPAHLERVLVNILVNAWRYGGPNVVIGAESVGDRVELTIADDGEGVPPEVHHVLFEPFHRGPQRHPEASGLGLAIVDGLLRRMGGSVVHRADGAGATFVISLEPA
jgi:PAS domain S-box-containing protein